MHLNKTKQLQLIIAHKLHLYALSFFSQKFSSYEMKFSSYEAYPDGWHMSSLPNFNKTNKWESNKKLFPGKWQMDN
jgi:hypothetical protein